MGLENLSAFEIVKQLSSGGLSSLECTRFFIERIAESQSAFNAFITTSESALEEAEAIDARRAAGEPLGPMAGIPIAIKDGICTSGLKTTAGSKMLKDFVPPYDATIVSKLRNADAIVIGKTNMDEFAMGSSTENSFFGVSSNPWNTNHVPGGSSGGSATSVAAGLAPFAIGSDTGGSIRQPAAFCGITGLKPTYGRVSRFGLIAFASSLDQIGPMTKTAEDAALVMSIIAGHDSKDSTSASNDLPDFLNAVEPSTESSPLSGLKIGLCQEHFEDGIDPEIESSVHESIKVFESLGATVTPIQLPNNKYAVATYYVIAPCEASSNLARYDGVRYTHRASASDLEEMYCHSRADGFGNEVKKRIMLGTYALSSGYYDAYYIKASKVRRLIKQDYDSAFSTVDLILGPTTPTPAFKIGQHIKDPLAMYLADVFTVSANLAGIPAISIPCGQTQSGLPIGLQLQARSFAEAQLLKVAHQFQTATDWHLQRPSS